MSDEYPECEKVQAVKEKSQVIGEFLEWLGSGEADDSRFKRPISLAATRIITERHDEPADEEDWYLSEAEFDLTYFNMGTERLLAKFFEIDLGKVEKEKRAMLAAIRKESKKCDNT